MVGKVLFSNDRDDWETPQGFFDTLNNVFSFTLDACASTHNTKCMKFFTREDDALTKDWARYGRVWLNPPYGRTIAKWMQKAYEESQRGSFVVCLVHARTDTKWWHNWVEGKADVTFVKGRLKFHLEGSNGKIGAAPFPSALVVYQPDIYHLLNT